MPARLPTKLKLIRGERKKSRLNAHEPLFPAANTTDPAPDWLGVHGQAEYVRARDVLIAAGVLTTADLAALAAYAHAYDQWREAAAAVRRDGLTVIGAHGGTVKHPAQNTLDSARSMMRLLMVELGLTPASRTRVKADRPPSDPLVEFLGRKGGGAG